MNYEHRYKEALDNAKVVYKTIRKDLKSVIEQIFPELFESEDEKDLSNPTDHWQDVRERAAIAAMQGMLSDGRQVDVSHVIKYSIICADELIKKLKGE